LCSSYLFIFGIRFFVLQIRIYNTYCRFYEVEIQFVFSIERHPIEMYRLIHRHLPPRVEPLVRVPDSGVGVLGVGAGAGLHEVLEGVASVWRELF
jgi:hypothetical protein